MLRPAIELWKWGASDHRAMHAGTVVPWIEWSDLRDSEFMRRSLCVKRDWALVVIDRKRRLSIQALQAISYYIATTYMIHSLNFTHPGNGAPTYMIHSFHTPFGRVNLTVVVPWLNALNVPNWLTYPTVGSLEVQVPFDPVT